MPLLWRQRVLGTKFAVSGLNLFRLFRSKIWPSQQGYSHSCPDFDFAQNSFRLFVFLSLSLFLCQAAAKGRGLCGWVSPGDREDSQRTVQVGLIDLFRYFWCSTTCASAVCVPGCVGLVSCRGSFASLKLDQMVRLQVIDAPFSICSNSICTWLTWPHFRLWKGTCITSMHTTRLQSLLYDFPLEESSCFFFLSLSLSR